MQGEEGAAILRAVMAGQLSVAQGAQAFVGASMVAQGAIAAPLAELDASALVGIAMDGRPLASLLYMPAITTAQSLAAGETAEIAALRGLTQMAMMTSTTVADTARAANSVAMAAHPRCNGYIRVVHTPACARCIVLAGRQYSRSEGFKRHPKCDCGMDPLSDAEAREVPDAKELFDQMTPEERHKRFGAAGVKAIESGSHIDMVVNARRGMQTVTTTRGKVLITSESTTRRGLGGKNLGELEKTGETRYTRRGETRMMPEEIMARAKGNRDAELSLLKKHGYIF
ncbi:hypothetical protein [Kitasatospora sp. NPDC092286]|uniref:VG15 protein n=1 Tax=Kitasatospora sp. NPDC092286 TaxID=3364087 RepID=UPI00380D8046